ncbi:MAG: transporter, partial [Alistipes sp.]|nr:transporter [Alistipes sp.]
MHLPEKLYRNVKTVAMPLAMICGVLLCRPITAFELASRQTITPILIFLMLFITFCRVKPSQMKLSMLHFWMLLFQI